MGSLTDYFNRVISGPPFQPGEDRKYEVIRLRSFKEWPHWANVRPIHLAKAGFSFTGREDEVCCFSCNGKIKEWQKGDDPISEHHRWFPECGFVNGQDGYVPLVSAVVSHSGERKEGTSLFSCLYEMKYEKNCLAAYNTWLNSQCCPEELAKAGFSFLGDFERVQCAFCMGILHNWEPGDSAINEHKKFFIITKDVRKRTLGPAGTRSVSLLTEKPERYDDGNETLIEKKNQKDNESAQPVHKTEENSTSSVKHKNPTPIQQHETDLSPGPFSGLHSPKSELSTTTRLFLSATPTPCIWPQSTQVYNMRLFLENPDSEIPGVVHLYKDGHFMDSNHEKKIQHVMNKLLALIKVDRKVEEVVEEGDLSLKELDFITQELRYIMANLKLDFEERMKRVEKESLKQIEEKDVELKKAWDEITELKKLASTSKEKLTLTKLNGSKVYLKYTLKGLRKNFC